MNVAQKTVAAVAALALLLPGAALAKKDGPHGKSGKTHVTAESGASEGSGKAGAPGQVCKSLKIKGKKTSEQRAAFKKCIQDAVAKRKAEKQGDKAQKDDDKADKDDKAEKSEKPGHDDEADDDAQETETKK